jgi:predicted PurR-regulated permease PerM
MTVGRVAYSKADVSRAVEVSINVGLVFVLAAVCFLILRPFLPLLTWGIIIAVACHPVFRKLQRLSGIRQSLAALLCTLFLLAILVVPAIFLAQGLIQSIQSLAAKLKQGSAIVPSPPPAIGSWPIVGAPLQRMWELAHADLGQALSRFSPQLKSILPGVVSASANIGAAVLQFFFAIVIAGVLLANAEAAYKVTCSMFNRVFADQGPELQQLVGATIRSVTFGILGVALIQAALAAAGFFMVGLPGVSLWAVIFLAAAVLQVGAVVLIPAVIYVFATATTTSAVIFLIWCIFVGLIDNVLKSLLLGRGVAVPVAVVFLGAIGGFVAMGIIGLFVGAIALSVGYKLSVAWLQTTGADAQIVE